MSETHCKDEGTQFECVSMCDTDDTLRTVMTCNQEGMSASIRTNTNTGKCTMIVNITFSHKHEAVAFFRACLAALTT